MTYLSQWLAEARAYQHDLEQREARLTRENERMARALGGIAATAGLCPVCAANARLAEAALQGVQRPPAPAVDPHTGCLIDVEGVPV